MSFIQRRSFFHLSGIVSAFYSSAVKKNPDFDCFPGLDYILTFLNLTASNHYFWKILLNLEYFISEFGE